MIFTLIQCSRQHIYYTGATCFCFFLSVCVSVLAFECCCCCFFLWIVLNSVRDRFVFFNNGGMMIACKLRCMYGKNKQKCFYVLHLLSASTHTYTHIRIIFIINMRSSLGEKKAALGCIFQRWTCKTDVVYIRVFFFRCQTHYSIVCCMHKCNPSFCCSLEPFYITISLLLKST